MIIKKILKFNILFYLLKNKKIFNSNNFLFFFNIIYSYKIKFNIQSIFYIKFNNLFFYIKKKKFIKKLLIKFNTYKLDLFFRFSKISYILLYNFKKYILILYKIIFILSRNNMLFCIVWGNISSIRCYPYISS